MENLLITGFVFLCILFAIVLTLHIAAERELKKKTRRLEEFESQSGWASNSPDHQKQTGANRAVRQSPESKEESGAEQARSIAPLTDRENNLTRRYYAVFSGTLFVFVSAAILTAGLWREYPDTETVEVAVSPAEKPKAANAGKEAQAAGELQKSAGLANTPTERKISAAPKRQEKPQGIVKTSQAAWRQYEILSATPVYSKPSEESQKVASTITGMKVSIVGVHGDWLEIRSRHGRPPGFIRKDSAAPAVKD